MLKKALIAIPVLLAIVAIQTVEPPTQEVYANIAPETEEIVAEVTSYSSDPLETDDTPLITASGSQVHDGTLACPRQYEFGTIVTIKGKEYLCEDRMSRKYPDRFDVWSPTKEAATRWGKQTLTITIRR